MARTEKNEKFSLDSDERARLIELISDNYIQTITTDMGYGDTSLLYAIITGEGMKALNLLSDEEILTEAKELRID